MKAFLSHSSIDKPFVDEVAERLGTAQAELDSATFASGALNVSVILAALKRCSIFVLFLTNDAIRSSFVKFEASMAQELMARGVIDRFLAICLDPHAFSMASDTWKSYSFARHISSPQAAARLIPNQLILERAKSSVRDQPYVERSKEMNDLKESLLKLGRSPPKGIYISGTPGIGRRTFARRLYSDRYPSINPIFAEVQIDGLDGYDEIYRKLCQELMPKWPLSSFRARIAGFALANDQGKAEQIGALLDQLVDSREAVYIRRRWATH